jgi:preprotein translocase subunit SecY
MNSALMRRAAMTLGALLVYRIGVQVRLPDIDFAVWDSLFQSQAGGLPFIFGGLSVLIVVCTLLDLQAQVGGYNFITISRERHQ